MAGVDLLLTGIGELVTNDSQGADLLGIVREATVAVADGRVTWAGPATELPSEHQELPELDCDGRAVIPGFVDAHTHIVFAGERSDEFARRLRGESYEAILAAGGGIRSTVEATRAASLDALMEDAMPRIGRMLAGGTTTAEVKSGYGLETATEVRMLETIAALNDQTSMDLVPTFLGAHVLPNDFRQDPDGYVRLIEEEMLPACAPLARYCDVFCEEGAFSVEESRRILEAGRRHGLKARIHANQLGPGGGAALAASVGAATADHLDHIDEEDIAALREAGTVAVLLPAVALSMRTPQPPGAALWEAGVPVAVATDCNPGTAYVDSMQLVVALAALEMGIAPEQALWSATRGGALAVEAPDKGRLIAGAQADLVVLDAPSYLHISYRPGTNLAWKVVKAGKVVVG